MNKNESKYFNTAKKMNDALLFLLEKKDYSYITISDICKKANVNRPTFYLHYENMSDLFEEVIENSSKSFFEHFKDTQKIQEAEIESMDSENLELVKDEYLIPYLSFVRENRNLFKTLSKHQNLFHMDSLKREAFQTFTSKILNRFHVDEKYQEYYFDFYVNGFEAILFRWCRNDCNLEIREVASLIEGLTKKNEKNPE